MNDSPLTSEALAEWTDQEVAVAWRRNSWDLGDPRADPLAAEMTRTHWARAS